MNKLLKQKHGLKGGIKGAGKPGKLIAANKGKVVANMPGGYIKSKTCGVAGSSRIVKSRIGKTSDLNY